MKKKMKVLNSNILTVAIFIIFLFCLRDANCRSLGVSSTFKNMNHGNREKITINLQNDDETQYVNPSQKHIARSFRRFIRSTSQSPNQTTFIFNDSHYVAEVHWSGEGSSSIMVLMKDPPSMSPNKPSYFYVSRDYGKTYTNYTSNFTMFNGSTAVITDFFSSKADHTRYILVAKYHKYIFTSNNECRTFSKYPVTFYPVEVLFHPLYSYYALAYEKDMGSQSLYVLQYGSYWSQKASNVKSYFWGYSPPYDYTTDIYYFNTNWYSSGGYVMKTTPWGYYYSTTLAYNVEDFELVNQYMFLTRNDTGYPGKKLLYVSVNRKEFRNTSFPSPHSADRFLIADATENETMVAVRHGQTSNLYISDQDSIKFSMSLSSILVCDIYNVDSKCGQLAVHDFVDLHRVNGLSGVYIATNLTDGKPGNRYLRSVITFDKGGNWAVVKPPTGDANCNIANGCSLHLSQEFGRHNPFTRFTPIYSRKSAPGYILATGNVGSSLTSKPSLFFSSDTGLSWKKLFDGNFYFALLDHGGVIVAVERYGFTNYVRYSWNEGLTWDYYKFSDQRIRIYGLLTEPGERTTIFTLFGSYSGVHSWVVMQVDMKNVLGNPCSNATGGSDYKEWELSDGRNYSQHCLLGKKQIFVRRDPLKRCYNGYDFDRPIKIAPCLCRREDYICDYGFKESWIDWFATTCIKDDNFEDYATKPPPWCRSGNVYNISSGYRKVPGDSCAGGDEKKYAPKIKMCPIRNATDFFFYAKRDYIVRYDINSGSQDTFSLNGLRNVIALDMDYRNNILFYADITVDKIVRLDLSSGNINTLVQFNASITHIEALAYDWLSGNLYYTDPGSAEIGIINITGGHGKTLLGSGDLDKPRALALYPVKGTMYWTDWGVIKSITRANMDGTKPTQIITNLLQYPNGLTIDYDNDKIYWIDAGMDRIERCDLDGTHRKLISSNYVSHPYSISAYNEWLYWSDWNQRAVLRTKMDSGSSTEFVLSYVFDVMDLKAFSPKRQKPGVSPCFNHKCKFMCLPTQNGYNCTCPDNLIAVNDARQCTCPYGEEWKDGECTSKTTCATNQFRCADGGCIPSQWRCDKYPDCKDQSDEKNCDTQTCSQSQFACRNGRCITASFKCDGEDDCEDRSDEINCSNSTCIKDHFLCANGRCITKNWLCDGDNDCSDFTDELNCNTSTTTATMGKCKASEFQCLNGRCVSSSYKCDGMNDCGDNSDELSCATTAVTCTAKQFRCSNSRCINKFYRCNGFDDCEDNSDEEHCNWTTYSLATSAVCGPGNAYCDDGKQCFLKSLRCNGIKDCRDGSDEKQCSVVPTAPACYGFQCMSGKQECLDKSKKCDGQKDCKYGEDENGCIENCSPSPFSFVCEQSDNLCHDASIACDGKIDCFDESDEDNKTLCFSNNRVKNLIASAATDGKTAVVSWTLPDVYASDIDGFNLQVLNKDNMNKVFNTTLNIATNSFSIPLQPCVSYSIAVAVMHKKVKWISTVVDIELISQPQPPSNVTVYSTDENDLAIWWKEDNSKCVDGWVIIDKLLICGKLNFSLSGDDMFIERISRYLQDIKNEGATYTCKIRILYTKETKIDPKAVESSEFHLMLQKSNGTPKFDPNVASNKKRNLLTWAIPVSLVLLILLLGLLIMAYKYRRLQNSFLALAARGSYSRQANDIDDEDEDEMVVGYRQGEDAPMINRFSDDEPLVVA